MTRQIHIWITAGENKLLCMHADCIGHGVHAYLALVLLHSDAGDTLFASILLNVAEYLTLAY